ncbi:MAG: PPC domain-containing DNA-binding protein [Candidatus Dormibacteria bacterium]
MAPFGEYSAGASRREGDRSFLLAFTSGSDLLPELAAWAQREGIVAASLSGIGTVSVIKFGMWNPDTKSYDASEYTGMLELAHCTGNAGIDRSSHERALHLHASVSLADGTMRGGHVLSAIVGATVEIVVEELGTFPLHRDVSPHDGLRALVIRDGAEGEGAAQDQA